MQETNKIILAGGSGFLGDQLKRLLTGQGDNVIILTRSPKKDIAGAEQIFWDGKNLGEWAGHLEGAKAVINLTGKSVNCRYNEQNRKLIIDSRVDSVNAIGKAIALCKLPPEVWIQAGSLAIYGSPGDKVCDEGALPADDFSARVCKAWEKAFNACEAPKTRKVFLRIGIVLGAGGGALGTLGKITKWGLGGTVGRGGQYISWVHSEDFDKMILWSLQKKELHGVYNACCPQPVTNKEFMRALRKALHRPWSPPAPAFAVKIGSWLMRTEPELALHGRRCIPKKLLDQGFKFAHDNLQQALMIIYE